VQAKGNSLASAQATTPTANVPAPTDADATGVEAPETDLIGSWVAQAKDTKIQLVITEYSQFKWTATTKDQPPEVLEGVLTS